MNQPIARVPPSPFLRTAALFSDFSRLVKSMEEFKAMSAYSEMSGGALVAPARQRSLVFDPRGLKRTRIKPSPFAKRFVKCQTGVNSGMPGPCPEGQQGGVAHDKPAKRNLPASQAELHSKAEPAAKSTVAKFKEAVAKIKSFPVIRQITQASVLCKKLTAKAYSLLEARYGKKTAIACLAFGQSLGWGALGTGAAVGIPLWLPGASVWGSLPAVAVAEAYLQGMRLAGYKSIEDASMEQIEEMEKWLMEEITRGYLEWLEENKAALVAANGPEKKKIKPSPFAKSMGWYRVKDACTPGHNPKRDQCTLNPKETASGGGGRKKPSKKPEQTETQTEQPQKRRAERGKLVSAKREGKGKEAKVTMQDGSPAPAHITPAMIPPAWSQVKISLNPDADVLVQGKMKNKQGEMVNKTVYNVKYSASQQDAKFAKIQEGLAKGKEIYDQNQKNRTDPELKENADCVWLMQEQATRPGSEADTKGLEQYYGQELSKANVIVKTGKKNAVSVSLKVGDKEIPIRDDKAKKELMRRLESGESLEDSTYWLKSHGATTLEGRHIVETPEGVRLRFMGKETVFHDHLVNNSDLAKMLLERKKKAGDTGKIFDTDNTKVGAYSAMLDGGKFTPKDFRTMKATSMAIEEINKRGEWTPKDEVEYKKVVMEIAEKVSGVLGNRAEQALTSYISPTVWTKWKAA